MDSPLAQDCIGHTDGACHRLSGPWLSCSSHLLGPWSSQDQSWTLPLAVTWLVGHSWEKKSRKGGGGIRNANRRANICTNLPFVKFWVISPLRGALMWSDSPIPVCESSMCWYGCWELIQVSLIGFSWETAYMTLFPSWPLSLGPHFFMMNWQMSPGVCMVTAFGCQPGFSRRW